MSQWITYVYILSRMPTRPNLWRQSSADVLVPYLWADVSGVERSGRVLVQRWLPARGRKYANQSQVQVQPVRQSGSWSDGGAEYHWLQRSVRQSGWETRWKRGCCGNSGWSHHSLHSTPYSLPKTRQKGQDKGRPNQLKLLNLLANICLIIEFRCFRLSPKDCACMSAMCVVHVFQWQVLPLADNFIQDTYKYEIHVYTGVKPNAGTDSNIKFVIAGTECDTGRRVLSDEIRINFQSGDVSTFLLRSPKSLGIPAALRMWHDNSG